MKFKTLKEIKFLTKKVIKEDSEDKIYNKGFKIDTKEIRTILRQEAIKDIKEMIRCKTKIPNCIICRNRINTTPSTTGFDIQSHNAIIEYIKWKFNIVEEDLK